MDKKDLQGAEIDEVLTEAITGAQAVSERYSMEGQDRVRTLVMDWDGCPGGFEMPQRVHVRTGPYGDYAAQFEGADTPFSSGLVQETLISPAYVRIGVLLRVTDRASFWYAMGLNREIDLRPADLEASMLRLPVSAVEAGIARITVSELSVERDEVYFEVSAEVTDMGRLVRAAREAYLEAWWDNTWLPGSPAEALFELALGSNANPSPDEMGFEILDYPETRSAGILRGVADREVSSSPGLVPDRSVPYAEWLELTGRDDSFVGNGHDVPGTRDLYRAAIRALPVPDRSGPEPE